MATRKKQERGASFWIRAGFYWLVAAGLICSVALHGSSVNFVPSGTSNDATIQYLQQQQQQPPPKPQEPNLTQSHDATTVNVATEEKRAPIAPPVPAPAPAPVALPVPNRSNITTPDSKLVPYKRKISQFRTPKELALYRQQQKLARLQGLSSPSARRTNTGGQVQGIIRKGKHVYASWQAFAKSKKEAFASMRNSSAGNTSNVPVAPVNVIRLSGADNANVTSPNNRMKEKKPIMAIVASVRSVAKHRIETDTYLYKIMMSSVLKTVTEAEQQKWDVRIYVAVDDNDPWWIEKAPLFQRLIPEWLVMVFGVFPKSNGLLRQNHVPFNEIAYTAYQDGAEYYCRVNDDTQFETTSWITTSVQVLQNYNPPNLGVTGPTCTKNTVVLTHDFVHRTHMDIFHGFYYPPSFNNWYLDDWSNSQYSSPVLGAQFHRVQALTNFTVKHVSETTRYDSNTEDSQWLPVELDRGRGLIRTYLEQHYPGMQNLIPPQGPWPQRPEHVRLAEAIKAVLPPDGNMMVWGVDYDSSPYFHQLTSGRVVFVNDESFTNNHQVPLLHPYLQLRHVKMEATGRGSLAAHEETFQTYVVHQSWQSNTWCELQIPSFPTDLVQDTKWDVILVGAPLEATGDKDMQYGAPLGTKNENHLLGPGIFQSLYMTQQIIRQQMTPESKVHVFVDHYEREHERESSNNFFAKAPNQVMETENESKESEKEPARYDHAHFVMDSNDDIVRGQQTACHVQPLSRDTSAFGTMPQRHIHAIFQALPRRGNILVWGADRAMMAVWGKITFGQVILLAQQQEGPATGPIKNSHEGRVQTHFIRFNQAPDKEALTDMTHENNNFPADLLFSIAWDAIVVDVPFETEHQWRQALHMSEQLAAASQEKLRSKSVTHVLVRNYEQAHVQKAVKGALKKESNAYPLAVVRDRNTPRSNSKGRQIKYRKVFEPLRDQAQFIIGTDGNVKAYHSRVDDALKAASDKKTTQWVILVQVDSRRYEKFLIWLSHFNKIEDLKHSRVQLKVITEDDDVHKRVEQSLSSTYTPVVVVKGHLIKSEFGISDAKSSPDVGSVAMPYILASLKERNNVILASVDTIWKKDPLPYLRAFSGDDAVDLVAPYIGKELDGTGSYYSNDFVCIFHSEKSVTSFTQMVTNQSRQNIQITINEMIEKYPGMIGHEPLPISQFPSGPNHDRNSIHDPHELAVVVHETLGHDSA